MNLLDPLVRFTLALPHPALLVTASGEVLVANTEAGKLWGQDPRQMERRPVAQLVSDDDVQARLALWASSTEATPGTLAIRRDGTTTRCHVRGNLVMPAANGAQATVLLQCLETPQHSLGFAALNEKIREMEQEVFERRRTERALRESEERVRQLLASTQEAIYGVDADGRCTFANPACATMLGLPDESQLIGEDMHGLVHYATVDGDDFPVVECAITATRTEGVPARVDDEVFWRHDGTSFPVDYQASPLRDSSGLVVGAVVVFTDITERKEAEQRIAESLEVKETLLQEIHHRVKNNLQIVSSLLSLDAAAKGSAGARETLGASRDRVQTMALLHEKLYQSPGLDRIDLGDYLTDLQQHLFQSIGPDAGTVRCTVSVASEPVTMSDAVPIGLIMNELISNALKHAFPIGRSGTLAITIQGKPHDDLSIEVRDDGVGLPEAFRLAGVSSLGLRLVTNLARQLDSSFTIASDQGTVAVVATKKQTVN